MKATVFVMVVAAVLLAACAPKPVACTQEAMICPDGTAVGRVPPTCEFAQCPEPVAQPTTFKEYKATDPSVCMRIRYTCDGDEMFSDEGGCGCVRKHNEAAVTLCAADVEPVCGWSDPAKIQCFAYPCAQTYNNLCMASIDPNVAYTTPGECPKVGDKPGREYVERNQTMCAATDWICGEGMQQFYDETGCGCEPAPKLQAIDCTDPRPSACTKEYMPVCGQAVLNTGEVEQQTYGNKCEACAALKVVSYTEGACTANGGSAGGPSSAMPVKKPATDCTDPRPEVCTLEYLPVCGQKSDGTSMTYGNKCSACADKDVDSYTQDACASDFATYVYQPKQCEETPWQTWYQGGADGYRWVKAPTDAELITAYYGNKNVEVSDVTQVESGMATCEACNVCDTSYSFTVKVRVADAETLSGEGWNLRPQNY